MAQAPSVETPVEVPLVVDIRSRDSTAVKDSKLVNFEVEKDPVTGDVWLEKRVGLLKQSTVAANLTGFGTYNWNGDVYSIFGTPGVAGVPGVSAQVYKNGTAITGVFGSVVSVDSTNGLYRFVQIRQDTAATPGFLVFGNGVAAYYTQGNVVTQITDPAFPSLTGTVGGPLLPSFCKGWAYLDGTLYVMDLYGNIWGTASASPDSPVNWDALNVIVARSEPDPPIFLAKQSVYVVALKAWTTEFFWDAGNATGSPLSSVLGAQQYYGCASGDSVQQIDGILIWMSSNQTVSPIIVMMDDLKIRKISTAPVERLLDPANVAGGVLSWNFKHGGRRLYSLTIINLNLTLVYDIDSKLWGIWTDPNGNYWPIVSMSYTAAIQHLAQHQSNGNIYYVDTDFVYPNDDGVLFPCDIYTENWDGGVPRAKQMTMTYFSADQQAGSILNVRTSDDDYQTWTNFRNVDLSVAKPFLEDNGSFNHRAWHLRHKCNTGFRIYAMSLQVDLGSL